MYPIDLHLAERTMERRVEEELHRASARCLCRLAQGYRQNGWASQCRRVASELAFPLVVMGARLVERGLPSYRPAVVGASSRNCMKTTS